MPVKPSYARDLPAAISFFHALTSHDWIHRKQVEAALGVSKTVAWRLMRMCGAEAGPGNGLVCRRLDFIAKLEGMMEAGGVVHYEVRRRQRLEEHLAAIRPQVLASRTLVVPEADATQLMDTRFTSLPPNVVLTPQSLHIEFHGTEDFMAAIGAVVYALHNDYEKVSSFIESR